MSDRQVTTVQQNDQLRDSERQGPSVHSSSTVPAEAVEVVPLAEVLRQVRRDAAREPQQYLDQTLVPFGGE